MCRAVSFLQMVLLKLSPEQHALEILQSGSSLDFRFSRVWLQEDASFRILLRGCLYGKCPQNPELRLHVSRPQTDRRGGPQPLLASNEELGWLQLLGFQSWQPKISCYCTFAVCRCCFCCSTDYCPANQAATKSAFHPMHPIPSSAAAHVSSLFVEMICSLHQ